MSSSYSLSRPLLVSMIVALILLMILVRSLMYTPPSKQLNHSPSAGKTEDVAGSGSMRFLSWNLEKKDLVDWSLGNNDGIGNVDVALFQEYSSAYRHRITGYNSFEAISFDTFGTAVFSKFKHTADYSVKSPHGDYRAQIWNGLIYKATAVAVLDNGVTVVSFHGYNGSLQGRNPDKLVDHITEVFKVIPGGPCVFAGDFNTFTEDHHRAVDTVMARFGFRREFVVPYDERKSLDMVYTRACTAKLVVSNHHESDHPFMVFDVVKSTTSKL